MTQIRCDNSSFDPTISEKVGYDLDRFFQDLARHAPSLFVVEGSACKVEIYNSLGGQKVSTTDPDDFGDRLVNPVIVSTSHGLESALNVIIRPLVNTSKFSANARIEGNLPPASSRVMLAPDDFSDQYLTICSVIYRQNSLSRMKITHDKFRLLCIESRLHPSLFSLIMGMGLRLRKSDQSFATCYTHFSQIEAERDSVSKEQKEKKSTTYDICYNFRHYEKHGRALQDPWSCREFVVHQKHYFNNSCSIWIIIHPLQSWDPTPISMSHPLGFHLRIIAFAVSSFREYLDYTSKGLSKLDQQVSFKKPFQEIDFDFSLSQHIHRMRRKLHHAQAVLDNDLEVVNAISTHSEEVQLEGDIPIGVHRAFLRELNNIRRDLKGYAKTNLELLNLSQDMQSIINSVIEFRDLESLNQNGAQLKTIGETGAKESATVLKIAQWTQNDSRTMRIATIIALLYLPANIILSFFSTTFVEFRGAKSPQDQLDEKLIIHGQAWIAGALILAAVFGTAVWFWVWDHRSTKKSLNGMP